MSKAFWNIKLLLVFSAENNAVPFAEGFAVLTQIYGNIKNLAFKASYQLALRIVFLKMQTSQNTLLGL